jgi:hypothetical protein
LYYLRVFNPLLLGLYVVLTAAWAIGGMMTVAACSRLKRSEILFAGIAAGFLLFTVLTNLFAHVLSLTAASWVSSGLILGGGFWLWFWSRRPALFDGRRTLASAFLFLFLFYLFQIVMRGLAVFDEFLHLPMISVMATGDIPPHFYLDPTKYFAYHYGLQIWSASLVRQAGFMPWSAFDLSRAFMLALTFVLAWHLFSRIVRKNLVAFAGAFLTLFAAGTRWLLLLLPDPVLRWLSSSVVMINSGKATAPSLMQALSSTWMVEGFGNIHLPFAFHNGIFVPAHFILGSTGAMPFMTVLLLLLIASRLRLNAPSVGLMVLILGSLALSAEHIFALLWISLLTLSLWRLLSKHKFSKSSISTRIDGFWASILVLSALLAIFQGGFITEALRSLAVNFFAPVSVGSLNYHGFSLRWPPAIPTAHFQELKLFQASNLLLLIIESGPILAFAPAVTLLAWRRRWGRHILWVGLALAAVLNMLVPLFIRYGVDRSVTRLPGTALWLWLVLGLQLFFAALPVLRKSLKNLVVILLCISSVGGIVTFALELTAVTTPQFSYFIDSLDTHIAARYWNELPPGAQVLDWIPYRSVTLFGRPVRAYSDIYTPLPSWSHLIAHPEVKAIVQAGYRYVYMDSKWWAELDPGVRQTYNDPCVKMVDEISLKDIEFRRLYDLQTCGK